MHCCCCSTDALGAYLLTSDIDPRDKAFCTGERTSEGFYKIRGGIDSAIARGLAYAPYADLVWFETGEPSFEEAEKFAKAIHEKYPGKLLSYNCSPSFNWKKLLSDEEIATFQVRVWHFLSPCAVACCTAVPLCCVCCAFSMTANLAAVMLRLSASIRCFLSSQVLNPPCLC